MSALSEAVARGCYVEAHRPFPRVVVDGDIWRSLNVLLRDGRATLSRPLG
jgi:hypothetical protein